jgi:hypothetical protein
LITASETLLSFLLKMREVYPDLQLGLPEVDPSFPPGI